LSLTDLFIIPQVKENVKHFFKIFVSIKIIIFVYFLANLTITKTQHCPLWRKPLGASVC
jgi:hypothetical protein